jgi:predicted aspartyl protease
LVILGNNPEVIMIDDMGCFRTDVEVENAAKPGDRRAAHDVLVDTGAELSWLPTELLEDLGINRARVVRFRLASGTIIERWVGFALVRAVGRVTADDIVFAEAGDMTLLGARTLEGLNVYVDPVRKQLVDRGPVLAAAAA